MKRKLSLHIKPDLAATADLDVSPEMSPKFEPPSPLIERRPLSPVTDAQLRHCCSTMVNSHMAVDWPDRSHVVDIDAARVYVERNHGQLADWTRTLRRPSSSSCNNYGVRIRPNFTSGAMCVPQNAASAFASTTASRSASLTQDRQSSLGPDDHLPPAAAVRHIEEDQPRGVTPMIRPQPSSESVRSRYSADSSVARPWWKGGSIRRYNSRSSHGAETQHETISPPQQEVDLNRALPPLPSLSSWKPEKPRTDRKVDRRSAQISSYGVNVTGQRRVGEEIGRGSECLEGPAERRASAQRKSEPTEPTQPSNPIEQPAPNRGAGEPEPAVKHVSDSKNARKTKSKPTVSDMKHAERQGSTSPSTEEKRLGRFRLQLSKMSLAGFRLHRSSSKRNGVATAKTTTATATATATPALIEAQ
ncbi:MAG: hypothetical protein M1816_007564 [Peltula sp. TS41687]|nr:MAG: hypothetical protein M1816_007564 [Peltula sp. TS41687]